MADKKVDRNVRSSDQERPQTPTQKMTGALSDSGTVNMAEASKDKGKTALLDRFREREERYRLDQSRAAAAENAPAPRTPAEASVEQDEEDDEGSEPPVG